MRVLISMSVLLLTGAAIAAPAALTPLPQATVQDSEPRPTQGRLDDLSRRVEAYYARRLAELEYRVTGDIAVLEVLAAADHPGLRIFDAFAHGELDADDYGMASRLNEHVEGPGPWSRKAVGGPAVLRQMRLAPAWLAAARLGIARERAGILARAQYEAARIEVLRDYVLDVQLPRIGAALPGGGADEAGARPGLVRGIIHTPNGSVALVGEAIVRQGDRLGETVVVSIHPDSVEFRKAGSVWTQRIGEPPGRW